MTSQELHSKLQVTKHFLNKEMVQIRVNPSDASFSFREIGVRLDMIHEAERKGVRNLGENENRKLTKMIREVEALRNGQPA